MADIYPFPTMPRVQRDAPVCTGVLVAMRHVDLDEVVETVLLLRGARRSQRLLDGFNRGTPITDRDRREAAE